YVEAGAVQDAFDAAGARIEGAGGQFVVLVAAAILQRVELAVVVEYQDRRVAVPDVAQFAGQELGGGADIGPALHRSSSFVSVVAAPATRPAAGPRPPAPAPARRRTATGPRWCRRGCGPRAYPSRRDAASGSRAFPSSSRPA